MKTEHRDLRTREPGVPLGWVPALCLALLPLQLDAATPPYRDPSLTVERRVADLLARMTLEEKVAQMQALWQGKGLIMDEAGHFSPGRAATAFPDGIGKIARANDQFGNPTGRKRGPGETVVFVNAVQKWATEGTRLGIPVLFHEEALHGVQALRGTNFPVPLALASSWDPALVEAVMTAAAREARARGARHVLAPVVDLALDPRWGRTDETYGEDPYLASRMGVAAIRGYQGTMPLQDEHVLATAKHFAMHGPHEGGINTAPTNYSERWIREVFLRPFRAAVHEAGVAAIMASYNEIDGIPSHANTWLLDQILRKEWGFQGIVVADYNGIEQLMSRHAVVASKEEAARKALAAGVDIELPDGDAYKTLIAQVRDGRVAESDVDRSVARLLRAKFIAGLFEDPYSDPERAEEVTGSPEHRRLALEAARKSIILLRNEGGLLPLDETAYERIAVIGPNAASVRLGGYSDDPGRGVSVLQGIEDLVGESVDVRHSVGVRIVEGEPDWWADETVLADPTEERRRIAEAVEVAEACDAVILVLGGNEATMKEAWADNHLGDRDTLQLPGLQDELVQAIAALGKPTVAFLIHGRPHAITGLFESVPAILDGWYMGQEGGTAAAEAIFGAINPAGKLTISVPRSVGQLPVYYNRKPTSFRGYLLSTRAPLLPFGHGLSYTTFTYDELKVDPARIGPAATATVSVRVTNSGDRAGDEVAQMYIRDRVSSATRPVKELKGFRRVSLEPGQSKTIEFELGPEALSLLDDQMRRVVEPGSFDVMVGRNSEDVASVALEVEAR